MINETHFCEKMLHCQDDKSKLSGREEAITKHPVQAPARSRQNAPVSHSDTGTLFRNGWPPQREKAVQAELIHRLDRTALLELSRE